MHNAGNCKLLEENMGRKLLDNVFIEMTSKAQATKTEINKWDYFKLKHFYTARKTTNKMKS